MKNLVEIRTSKIYLDADSRTAIIDYYHKTVNEARELFIWDNSIHKIVITDDIIKEVNEQAQNWGLPLPYPESVKRFVASKILWDKNLGSPKAYIFINIYGFLHKDLSSWDVIIWQILMIYAERIIPTEIKSFINDGKHQSLNDWVKVAAAEWCKTAFTQKRLLELKKPKTQLTNHKKFLIAFERKFNRILFKYNSDYADYETKTQDFWNAYWSGLNGLIISIITNYTEDESLLICDGDKYKGPIYDIVQEVYNLKDSFEKGVFDFRRVKNAIKEFSDTCAVQLIEGSKTTEFRLKKNPKDYFNDKLVDTEPRIVCYMDILGFGALIDEYENNYESTILSDIHESFATARKAIFDYELPFGDEYRQYIKHQTFSDNICVSIPYFDNEQDFTTNFILLMNYIRGFQASMMSKGIFIRGGLSLGSFYSDDNIIFSKGLIKAYYLESKQAVYPRVVIGPEIVQKLMLYNRDLVSDIGTVIILDWENTAFLNPFDLTEYLMRQVRSLIDNPNLENQADEEPIIKTLRNIVGDQYYQLKHYLDDYRSIEKKEIEKISEIIRQNIEKNQGNHHILSKYLWLYDFIKWNNKDDSSNLKFKTLTDYLKHK